MNLQDQMSVAADAARKAKRNIKAAKKRARRAAIKGAAAMNAKMITNVASKRTKRTTGEMVAARAKANPASAANSPKAVPVKVTVKKMVLDVFYIDPKTALSTKQAVAAIQADHPSANESSIRVWISDFQKDGSIKLVKREGRQAILKAGKIGGRFSKGYVAT